MNQRLFFDVTQLVHWPGKLTGIPRVMQELAIRFDKDPDLDCRCVTWVKEREQFCEVDLTATLAQRGQRIVYLSNDHGSLAAGTKTPPAVVKRVVKSGLAKVGKLHPGVAGKIEQKAKIAQAKSYKAFDFKSGDQLIIPWGEWSDEVFISQLKLWQTQGLKIIQMVHDIGPIITPQFANAGNASVTLPAYLRSILPISDLVLAISESTKQMVITWLSDNHLPLAPIKVFREGDDFSFAAATKPHDQAFLDSNLQGHDYLLMVGTIEPKKNHQLLYNVYKLASMKKIDLPKLVIVGRRGWRSDDIFGIMSEDPEVKDKFVWLLNASDEELSWLYDHCLFTVFSSLFEGWGIPVAESLSRGVPVLASNATSLPEVGGDFAEYFTPTASEECLTKIVNWLKPDVLAKAQAKVKRYKPTSWDDSFHQIKSYLGESK